MAIGAAVSALHLVAAGYERIPPGASVIGHIGLRRNPGIDVGKELLGVFPVGENIVYSEVFFRTLVQEIFAGGKGQCG